VTSAGCASSSTSVCFTSGMVYRHSFGGTAGSSAQ
jgi:hypothetical protein